MSKQIINIGSKVDDGTGDTLRTGFTKTNNNFSELYTSVDYLNTSANTLPYAYIQANTATVVGQSAYQQANTATTQANLAFNQANTATLIGQAAYTQANTVSVAIYNTQIAIDIGVAAFHQANVATIIGQSAYAAANTARTVPQNSQSSNYTLQLTDAGKYIYYTQSSNSTLYIPPASEVLFSNGTIIMIVSKTSSNAQIVITPNTGVSLYLAGNNTSTIRNLTTYGVATLMRVAANTWFISGTGLT